MLIFSQIQKWNQFFPIFSIINNEKPLKEWLLYVAPYIYSNDENKNIKTFYNLSDVTFSVEFDEQSENYSRFSIGIVENENRKVSLKDIEFFLKKVKEWSNLDLKKEIYSKDIIGIGMGFDFLNQEKRIYYGWKYTDKQNNIKGKMKGYNLDYNTNQIKEEKDYIIYDEKYVLAKGQIERKQFNVNKDNFSSEEIKNILNKLPNNYQKKALRIINQVTQDDYFWIDTISIKLPKVVLYFS